MQFEYFSVCILNACFLNYRWSWLGGGDSSSSSNSNGSGGGNGDEGDNNERNNNDDAVNNNYYGNSVDDYNSPLTYFDLSDCGSYSNLWLWDLALSCDNSTSLVNCECTSTEILFQYGTLQCPDGSSEAPYCPSNCPVCHTCMKLQGCIDKLPISKRIPINIPTAVEKTIDRTLPIALGVAAALVVVAAAAAGFKYKNRAQNDKLAGSLDSSLMGEQSETTVELDIAGNAHVLEDA